LLAESDGRPVVMRGLDPAMTSFNAMMISLLHVRPACQGMAACRSRFKRIGLAKNFRDNPAGF
jgi:hypothetical protein